MELIWKIANLERTLPSGVVSTVHYTIEAIDDGFTAGAYGSHALAGDPAQDGFIPFDQLDEATVIAWVKAALGEEKVASVSNSLAAQIDLKKNPKIAVGTPWAPAAAE